MLHYKGQTINLTDIKLNHSVLFPCYIYIYIYKPLTYKKLKFIINYKSTFSRKITQPLLHEFGLFVILLLILVYFFSLIFMFNENCAN